MHETRPCGSSRRHRTPAAAPCGCGTARARVRRPGGSGAARAGEAHARPPGGRAADGNRARFDGCEDQRRRRDRSRLRSDAEPLLLFLIAQELRHAVDERRPQRVRGSQRLHGHRDRDDPRRRALRSGAQRGSRLRRRARRRRDGVLAHQQRPLPRARGRAREPRRSDAAGAGAAVDAARRGARRRRNGGRHHDPRRR